MGKAIDMSKAPTSASGTKKANKHEGVLQFNFILFSTSIYKVCGALSNMVLIVQFCEQPREMAELVLFGGPMGPP